MLLSMQVRQRLADPQRLSVCHGGSCVTRKFQGPLARSRLILTSSAFCPGKLFVVGGFDGSHALRCVEVYDPARNEWRMLGSMTSSRSNAGVAMLGETIYAVGGFDGNEFLNTMEVYNPETDEWNDCTKALFPLSD